MFWTNQLDWIQQDWITWLEQRCLGQSLLNKSCVYTEILETICSPISSYYPFYKNSSIDDLTLILCEIWQYKIYFRNSHAGFLTKEDTFKWTIICYSCSYQNSLCLCGTSSFLRFRDPMTSTWLWAQFLCCYIVYHGMIIVDGCPNAYKVVSNTNKVKKKK